MNDKYQPKVIDDHGNEVFASIVVELNKCGVCNRPMFPSTWKGRYGFLARSWEIDKLMQSAGFVWDSNVDSPLGHNICTECAADGKGSFICSLCGQERRADQVKENYGYPVSDYLCTVCYETQSAKLWDEWDHKLHKAHQYDAE